VASNTAKRSSKLVGAAIMLTAVGVLAQPAMAETIKLTCRATGAWADRPPQFLKIDEDNGALYVVFADGSPEGDGTPHKFDKNSDFIAWGEPNGDTTNFWSLDRVSGDMRFDAPSGVGSGRSVETFHCAKPATDRAF
jgi:hypothetical protein